MILPLKPSRRRKVKDAMYGQMQGSSSSEFKVSKSNNDDYDETCSCSFTSTTSEVSSSLGSANSTTNKESGISKTVQFDLQVEILCEDDRTHSEVQRTWLGPLPIIEAREQARSWCYHLLEQPEYQKAIDYLRIRLGKGAGSYAVVDLDDECFAEDADEYENAQEIIAKAVLTDGEARGLERTALSQVDGMRGCVKGVKQHVNFVLQAQALSYDTDAIAQVCRQRSQPAQEWAQAIGQADADAVAQNFMLAL